MVPQGHQNLLWHEGSPAHCISTPSWLPVSLPNTFDLGTVCFPAVLMPWQGFGRWWLFPCASSGRDQLQPALDLFPHGPRCSPQGNLLAPASYTTHGHFSVKSPAWTGRELQGGAQDLQGQDVPVA